MTKKDLKIVSNIERTLGLIKLGLLETARVQDPILFAYCNQRII